MLISSKNKKEKIVWGLLSYTFEEEQTAQEQQVIIESYRDNDDFEIYLYKETDNDNYIGAMVVEVHEGETVGINSTIMIHRVGILPTFREEGYGYKMFVELKQLYPNALIQGSLTMSEIVKNWAIKYREQQD